MYVHIHYSLRVFFDIIIEKVFFKHFRTDINYENTETKIKYLNNTIFWCIENHG